MSDYDYVPGEREECPGIKIRDDCNFRRDFISLSRPVIVEPKRRKLTLSDKWLRFRAKLRSLLRKILGRKSFDPGFPSLHKTSRPRPGRGSKEAH